MARKQLVDGMFHSTLQEGFQGRSFAQPISAQCMREEGFAWPSVCAISSTRAA